MKDIENLKTDGLQLEEVGPLREKYGFNEIERKKPKTKLEILIEVIKDPIILIMIVAAVISYLTGKKDGDFSEAIVISILIVVNILISYLQEINTLQKLESLNALNEDTAFVVRSGREVEIPARELLPGDLVKLNIGFIARADMVLIEESALAVDESFLTGESEDVEKEVGQMVYSNSSIKKGQAYAIVKTIGMNTKIGEITQAVDEVEVGKSQLENKILNVTKILLVVAAITALIIGILTYLNGESLDTILTVTISILIATVPEGLATVLTIVLTYMSQKMYQNKALVKKVELLETLGEIEYVCSDKTGTITENQMTVTDCIAIDENELTTSLTKAVIDQETPTSNAIFEFLQKFDTNTDVKLIDKLPFNSTIKKAGYLVEDVKNKQNYLVVVGAPDFIVTDIKKKHPEISDLTAKGLRTLAVMYEKTDMTDLEVYEDKIADAHDMDLIAIYGIQDPPKQSAIDAVEVMHNAKINTVMITGDNIDTARSIAKQAGILQDDYELCLTGEELNNMTDEEFVKIVDQVRVYARVKPEDKFRIVSTLQSLNKIVAMTGDGTNDSIALRKADVGVAMGIQGTDIAKESADLILLDDNFATINEAIRGGRLIFDNLRKFIKQMLTSNAAHTGSLLFALLIGVIMGTPNVVLPMSAVLILWVNVVSDAIPCLALGLDTEEPDLMDRPPIDPDMPLLTKEMMIEILIRGLGIGLLVYITFTGAIKLGADEHYARTLGFIVLSFGQLINIFETRSLKTVYRKNLFENKLLWAAVLASSFLNLLIIYSPLNKMFGLVAVSFRDLIIAILISGSFVLIISLIKLIYQLITESKKK